MTDKTTLIFGAGYSGKTYGKMLVDRGETVFGTTRSADKSGSLKDVGIHPLVFDGERVSAELSAIIGQATDIVISIAPDESGDPVINAAAEMIKKSPNLVWLAYLSTVGVYGNHDGAWVDETNFVKPVSVRSKQRVAAENAWQGLADAIGVPLSVLRLSGIYGPGRNQMISLEKGTARRLVKKNQVFNRIHVEDIARAIDFLSGKRSRGIWNVTDNRPAPPQDVVEYVASVMKIDPPDEIDFETATLSPMARSFYGENKRVSNAKIKDAGFDFEYPDYETAFRRMWDEESWR